MKLDYYDVCEAGIKGKQGLKCLVSKEISANLWRRFLGHVGINRQVNLQNPC